MIDAVRDKTVEAYHGTKDLWNRIKQIWNGKKFCPEVKEEVKCGK